jgi:hypothetical protein
MNRVYEECKYLFKYDCPTNEDELLNRVQILQNEVFDSFDLSESLKEIFKDFHYAINENEDKIYFDADTILDCFYHYLASENKSKLIFGPKDPVFDFLRYNYDYGTEEEKKIAGEIVVNFVISLYGFIVYRDYLKIIKSINHDVLISPIDNHIPIRIALLNSLNIINDLHNTVPNKENIYRIVHAIVGGNEDNVKKYCLSLIGQNSTSQKQITKKHLDFAQRYINEKRL